MLDLSERASRTTRKLLIAWQLKLAQVTNTILPESAFQKDSYEKRNFSISKSPILQSTTKKTLCSFLYISILFCILINENLEKLLKKNQKQRIKKLSLQKKKRFLKLLKIHHITTRKLCFTKNRSMRKTRPRKSSRHYEIIFRSTAKQEVISVARTKLLWDYSSLFASAIQHSRMIDRSMSP